MVLSCSQVNDIPGTIFSLKYMVIKPLHYSPGWGGMVHIFVYSLGGGGGGGYMIFYIFIGLADFFWGGGVKILHFDIFGGFRKIIFLGGMKFL